MKVSIKEFRVAMELKNKGMELEIRNNSDEFLGDLRVTKTGLEWCQGKSQSGEKKTWDEVISFFEKGNK